MQLLTRRQALATTALSLASFVVLGSRPAAAQIAGRPQFLMFHVEAGW